MIARDGYPYIFVFALIAILGFFFKLAVVGLLAVLLVAFMAFFFRDPERPVPQDERAVVSPADGKVVRVTKLDPTNPQSPTRLSIFLSVFDVHVNRAPIAGRIKEAIYQPGKFKVAYRDEASQVNEQNAVTIEGRTTTLVFKQIAGILARRIVFSKRPGDWVHKGERVGLMKFGSRTDLILPPDVEVTVTVGDQVYGGSSIVGRIQS
jgi:phosphatidylserine decarboxylase